MAGVGGRPRPRFVGRAKCLQLNLDHGHTPGPGTRAWSPHTPPWAGIPSRILRCPTLGS